MVALAVVALLACHSAPCTPVDADGDGFPAEVCGPAGPADCDDADPFVHPGAAEVCDGVDNDCSGIADERWDADLDGTSSCAGDCDDNDPTNAPNFVELCDGSDNNCDGVVDEGFDADGDGQASCRGDCDDHDPTVYFGAVEACDGVDNDCDPSTSESGDLDGDGVTRCEGDCDDLDPTAYPGATEVCDGVDNDCNGEVDELEECWGCIDEPSWRLCPVYVDWSTARAACQAWGFDLAILHDDAENVALGDAIAADIGDATWIGLTDADVEGTFMWIDGSAPTYTSWNPGEPNDAGGEDCAGTNFGNLYGWNDFSCASALPFACAR